MTEIFDSDFMRQDAESVLEHLQGLSERLAKFQFELEEARTIEEVGLALAFWCGRLGEILSVIEGREELAEADRKRTERLRKGN